MNKLQEIRQALEAATPDWKYNGNEIVSEQNPGVGIGGFLKDEDNRLAAYAPEYLSYLLQLVETQANALKKAEKFTGGIMGFYGEGLTVNNWHQNGDTEPLDNFFDENMEGDELEVIREALKEISQ